MRYAKLGLTMLLSGLLWGADSYVGTWKLNHGKSKFRIGQPAKEQMIVIDQQGDNYHVTVRMTAANGSETTSHYTVPIDGGKGAVIESAAYDEVTAKRIDANTRENTFTKEGKPVITTRVAASEDGKTLSVTVKGTDAQGKRVQGIAVFDKQ